MWRRFMELAAFKITPVSSAAAPKPPALHPDPKEAETLAKEPLCRQTGDLDTTPAPQEPGR